MRDEEPEIVGEIMDIEVIAVNTSIRELAKLRAKYGGTRWRKLKGKAYVIDENGNVNLAEVHWYECVRREAVRELAGKPSSGRELYH